MLLGLSIVSALKHSSLMMLVVDSAAQKLMVDVRKKGSWTPLLCHHRR